MRLVTCMIGAAAIAAGLAGCGTTAMPLLLAIMTGCKPGWLATHRFKRQCVGP
jgi:hypothetical protein